MMARHALPGRIESIFLRPLRRAEVGQPSSVIISNNGLAGDHASAGKRAVTLVQAEHLPVISALLGIAAVDPAKLRRNLVVSGINLLALRKTRVQIGECILLIHGPCPPCSRMEEAFGNGGYSAVRGHGGVYAEVIQPGAISIGSSVCRWSGN
ncbi:MAG: MOSC domain-containing protein [Boseongicola sp.]|nr:MOSC domain-containing protein [Boseongicola sp.]NNJ68733.1 MOSC domain-containing protein [Boseongicola sp.]